MKTKIWVASVVLVCGCAPSTAEIAEQDGTLLKAAPDDAASTGAALSQDLPIGSILATTANLNLRTGPGTSNSVRLVISSGGQVTTINSTSPSNGFYNVKYNGVEGFCSGTYLKLVSEPSTGTMSGGEDDLMSATPGGAILRAKSAVGGTYWWGHGKWYPNNVGGDNSAGSCTGSCPNCTHSGSSGADCSGYVGKLWQVPSTNTSLTTDSHPYSTASFVSDTSAWHTVSRDSVQSADALVYNSNGEGHIFLYASGDGWGSMNVYEAKGCSYGILYDLRTASSAYHAIRHY